MGPHNIDAHLLGSGFGRTDFVVDFYVLAAGFPRPIFSPHFCGEKVPRKILQENPLQNPLQNLYSKSPRHISAEGPTKNVIGKGCGSCSVSGSKCKALREGEKGAFRKSSFVFLPSVIDYPVLYNQQSPKGHQNGWGIKMASFFEFGKLGILVPVCFATRLGVSFSAPKGVSKRMGYQNGKFLDF